MTNHELVQGIYDAVNRGDLDSVLAAMTDDIEFQVAEHSAYWTGEPFRGPAAVATGVLAHIGEDFDGFTIVVERIADCGDIALAQLRYQATAKATGKPLDVQVAHVFDVRDGKVCRFQQYIDTWQSAQVTGKVGGRSLETSS